MSPCAKKSHNLLSDAKCLSSRINCVFRYSLIILKWLSFTDSQAPPGTARRKRRSESRRQFADSASTRPGPRGFGARNWLGKCFSGTVGCGQWNLILKKQFWATTTSTSMRRTLHLSWSLGVPHILWYIYSTAEHMVAIQIYAVNFLPPPHVVLVVVVLAVRDQVVKDWALCKMKFLSWNM